MEKNSPSATSRSIPATASTSPNRLLTPSRRTAATSPAGDPARAGSRPSVGRVGIGVVNGTSGDESGSWLDRLAADGTTLDRGGRPRPGMAHPHDEAGAVGR